MFLKELRENNSKIFIFGVTKSSILLMKILSRNNIEVFVWDDDVKLVEKLKESLTPSDQHIKILNVDDCNFDNLSYFIISKNILMEEEEIKILLKRLDKIENKVYIDIEFFYLLFPNNKFCGIFGSVTREITTGLIWHILDKAKINNLALSLKNSNFEENVLSEIENNFISLAAPLYKLKYIKNLQFDVIALLNIPQELENKGKEEIENFLEKNKKILLKQKESSTLIINIGNKVLKIFYNNLLKEESTFNGQIIPIAVNTILEDGFSLASHTIYNYYKGENKSYDLVYNENLKGDLNKNSILLAFVLAILTGVEPKKVLDYIANFQGVENCLNLIKEYRNVKYINNVGASSLEMLLSPLETYENILPIFVINSKQASEIDFKYFQNKINNIYIVDSYNLLDKEELKKIKHFNKIEKFVNIKEALDCVNKDLEMEDNSKEFTVLLSPVVASELNGVYYHKNSMEFINLINKEN